MIVIRSIIWLIATFIWLVIGFFFWIAILSRTIAYFSIITITLMLDRNDSSDITIPRYVLTFYVNGFISIIDSIFRNESSDKVYKHNNKDQIDWIKIGLEIVWCIVFWLPVFYILHKLFDIEAVEFIFSKIRSFF